MEVTPDWPAIRALYSQGISSRIIGERFGIQAALVRKRAMRENWGFTSDVLAQRRHKRNRDKTETVVAAKVAADIWADRRDKMRDKLHLIGERITDAALKESPEDLLKKAEKVKIAFELGAKGAGVEQKEQEASQVNIAILSDIGGSTVRAEVYDVESEPVTAQPSGNEEEQKALPL
jgi:hypothetical protein